jgi:hypothetical protein
MIEPGLFIGAPDVQASTFVNLGEKIVTARTPSD